MHVAQAQLEAGDLAACKTAILEGQEELEGLSNVDPSVSAAVYYVSCLGQRHALLHKDGVLWGRGWQLALRYLVTPGTACLQAGMQRHASAAR